MVGFSTSVSRVAVALITLVVTVGGAGAQTDEANQRYRLALGYEQANDLKNASRVYLELYQADPQSNVFFQGVQRTYSAMLRFKELLPIVEERSKRFSRDGELRALYANLLKRNGRPDDAESAWREAVETKPEDQAIYREVANSQTEVGAYDLAIATYLESRSRTSDPYAFAEELAALYGRLGRIELATTEYLGLLETGRDKLNPVMSGMSLFTSVPSATDRAIVVVRERRSQRTDYQPYLEILAWLYNERGDDDGALEAAKLLDEQRRSKGSAVYGLADRALREEKFDLAIKALDHFLATYPVTNSLSSLVMLTYARALEGRYRSLAAPSREQAEELAARYRRVVAENKGTPLAAEATVHLATLLSDDLDDTEKGIEILEALRRDFPRSGSARTGGLLLGDLYLRQGDTLRAGRLFTELESPAGRTNGTPDNVSDLAALRLGEISLYGQQIDRAAQIFTGLTNDPANPAANDALGYLFLINENRGKHDSALVHYAAGRYLMVRREWKEAIEEFNRGAMFAKGAPIADEALYWRADAEHRSGDPQGSVKTLLALVVASPDGLLADKALFRAAEITERELSNPVRAIELYTELLTRYERSSLTRAARQKVRTLRKES